MPLISKTLAFYRVFFRHDHWRVVAALNVLPSVEIVVGKDVLNNVDLELSKLLKESARIANASERVDTLAGKAGQVSFAVRHDERPETHGLQSHAELASPGDTVRYLRMHGAQPCRRLAQRACGQAITIAKTALAVDYGNFEIAGHRVVLQAIVTDDDIAVVFGNQLDRKSTRLNSSHMSESRMPSSA